MADIEHKITVSSRITDVFKLVTNYDDAESIKTWQPAITSIGVTAGNPIRTGSMIAIKKQFFMSEIFVNMDILDIQRNKRVEFKGYHGRFPFQRVIEFTPQGTETTISDSISINTGFLYFLWRPFLLNTLKGQTAKEWQRLQQHIEQDS